VQFQRRPCIHKALVRFEELVPEDTANLSLSRCTRYSSNVIEKQYFEYMSQGKAVDYASVCAASHAPSQGGAFIDARFVFKGHRTHDKVVRRISCADSR